MVWVHEPDVVIERALASSLLRRLQDLKANE